MRLAAGAALADRLRDIVGAELVRQLRPLDLTRHDVTVRGYAGQPSRRGRTGRSNIFSSTAGPRARRRFSTQSTRAITRCCRRGGTRRFFCSLRWTRNKLTSMCTQRKKKCASASRRDSRRGYRSNSKSVATEWRGESAELAADDAVAAMTAAVPAAPQMKLLIPDLPPPRTFQFPGLPMMPPASPASAVPPQRSALPRRHRDRI